MRKKMKKIVLALLVAAFLILGFNLFILPRPVGPCGCEGSYMGADLVYSYCEFVGGELLFRQCVYEY